MEHVNKLADEFEKYAKNVPEFTEFCKKQNLPPGLVLLGITAVLTVLGVILQGYNLVCVVLTIIYPIIQSIKTIESGDPE